MNNRKGSILAQTLINLVVFAMFMHIAFHSIYRLSNPRTVHHLKLDYLQLQLNYLSTLYAGASISDDTVCFKENHCLEFNHNRLVLTPGYQILMENIQSFEILDFESIVRIIVLHQNKWVHLDVKK